MDAESVKVNILPRGKTEIIPCELKTSSYYDEAAARIKYFTINEIKCLINGTSPLFYKMVYLFLFETAARISEARNVKFSDIDLDHNKVTLLTLKQRKQSGIYRVLWISDSLKALLLQYRLLNTLAHNDYIFARTTGGQAVSKQAVDKALKQHVMASLGADAIDRAHPHTFRHSRAISLLDSGMNIMKLKRVLGHASIQNTEIYTRYSNRDLLKSIDEANRHNGLI